MSQQLLRAAVTGALLISATATACTSSEAEGDPTSSAPPGTSSAAPSTTSSSSSASPTSSLGPGADGVPAAARAHTKAGAIAFAEHYNKLANDSHTSPKADVLEPLALTGCKSCESLAGEVKQLVSKNHRYSAPPLSWKTPTAVEAGSAGYDVFVQTHQRATSIIDAAGLQVDSAPELDVKAVFLIRWTGAGWRVKEIQTQR